MISQSLLQDEYHIYTNRTKEFIIIGDFVHILQVIWKISTDNTLPFLNSSHEECRIIR
jgi:hypothetical protein